MCPPERPHSGVSIPKIHALCAGIERWMCPCRATRAGTQAPPLPISIIFFHTIPPKQNNHLRVICPNETTHSTCNLPKCHSTFTRNPPKRTVGEVPACPPERPRSGVSIPKITYHSRGMNDGCALAGRHGRAHRRRPYPSPLYIYTSGAGMHHALPLPHSFK